MAILPRHIPYYEEILSVDGAIRGDVTVFGYQEVRLPRAFASCASPGLFGSISRGLLLLRWSFAGLVGLGPRHPRVPARYIAPSLCEILVSIGAQSVRVIDLYDERADLRVDMNKPISTQLLDSCDCFIDIGCLEHLFDTRQCLENCLSMVRTGGHYVLHTPVNGYFAHGLHVFNPDAIRDALLLNGFEMRYECYTTARGARVVNPARRGDILFWLVAQRVRRRADFVIPTQEYWDGFYRATSQQSREHIQQQYWRCVGRQ